MRSSRAVADARRRLTGAWRLEAYQDRASAAEDWTDTYGPGVDGLIVYDESGWLAVQVSASDGRYDAYFGHFDIVSATPDGSDIRGVALHQIIATSMPELLTADQERPFRVSGQNLILGDEETWQRVCTRLSR